MEIKIKNGKSISLTTALHMPFDSTGTTFEHEVRDRQYDPLTGRGLVINNCI